MNIELGRIVILVNDYDEAFKFYEENFGCKKFFDLTDGTGQRFLHISFGSESTAGIWFLKAETGEQQSRVGNQTGGQPALVLYTDSFDLLIEKLIRNQIKIIKETEITDEYISLSILDLYGNEIVIVERRNKS